MVKTAEPKYARLSIERTLSYRPSDENVAAWHTVRTRSGRVDNLQTIAEEYEIPVVKLIEFNFPGSTENGRVNPDIVNWYLHNHKDFRCQRTTVDRANYLFKGGEKIAIPLLGLVEIGAPVLPDDRIANMTFNQRIGEAMERSIPHLPENAQEIVRTLIKPESLALFCGTLAVWAGSHFFGIGEIVDVILLVIGVATVGFGVFEGASEFYEFVEGAQNAKTNAEIEVAAKHFANSVTLLGIAIIQALLMRGSAKAVLARGKPKVQPRFKVGTPPANPKKLNLSRPWRIPGGDHGQTSPFGVIRIARDQSLTEQQITLLHELVHRFFSPRSGPLLRFRAELRIAGYNRSAFLVYLEEALAEGYGQLRVNGLMNAIDSIRFPVDKGYVTISALITEGTAIGSIFCGGMNLQVSISTENMPDE